MRLGRVAAVGFCVVLVTAGCGEPKHHAAEPKASHSKSHSKSRSHSKTTHTSARTTLRRYLDLSFSGKHRSAWTLLTAKDRRRTSRAEYVRQGEANDQLRNQVRALGPVKYHIASVRERGSRVDAVVTVTTGLGTDRERFVLRKEHGRWRIDYRASWSSAD